MIWLLLLFGAVLWWCLVPLWFVFNLAAYGLCWLLPVFATQQLGMSDNNHARTVAPRLPWCLSWFMTDDNSLLGDAAFAEASKGRWAYWSMVRWLARNPAVGFERRAIGARITLQSRLRVFGNPQVQDGPAGRTGWCFVIVDGYWNLVAIIPTTAGNCIKVDIGWALKTFAEQPARLATAKSARYAFSPRPTKFVTTGEQQT